MEISVVIPTLNNREMLLLDAVKSVSRQRHRAAEILIVNNGVGELLLGDLTAQAAVISATPYCGVGQARNLGVVFASSEYIAFLDDDDYWDADFLFECVREIESRNAPDLLIGDLRRINEVGLLIDVKSSGGFLDVRSFLYRNRGATGSSIIVKRSSFLEVSGFDSRLKTGEDVDLVIEMLLQGRRVYSSPKSIAYNRAHGGERLTDPRNEFQGTVSFLRKRRKLMSFLLITIYLTRIFKLWLRSVLFLRVHPHAPGDSHRFPTGRRRAEIDSVLRQNSRRTGDA